MTQTESANIEQLLQGYKHFYTEYFKKDTSLYQALKDGQHPKILMIACSDSRADPSVVTQANPGDIFVVRNVANLVPPYQTKERSLHGVSAAVEFAVRFLQVEHIVILGHRHCGGVQTLMYPESLNQETDFLEAWMGIAKQAKSRVLEKHPNKDKTDLLYHCEQESILLSLDNLLTFPWLQQRVTERKLQIHGWHFNIEDGSLHRYQPELDIFEKFEI